MNPITRPANAVELECTMCHKSLPAIQFRLTRYNTRESWCVECGKESKREWWRTHRAKSQNWRV